MLDLTSEENLGVLIPASVEGIHVRAVRFQVPDLLARQKLVGRLVL